MENIKSKIESMMSIAFRLATCDEGINGATYIKIQENIPRSISIMPDTIIGLACMMECYREDIKS